MHSRKWLIAILLAIPLAIAGCIEEESTDRDDDAQNARHFTVDVPAGATQVHVDATGEATSGEPDVTILIEDEAGNNLATDTFSVGDSTTRRVSADVNGHARLVVTVRVVDGDAELTVRVSATVPDRPDVVVITEERIVIVQVQPAPQQPPAAVTPPGATPPPSPRIAEPSPTPSPAPTPTNTTNTTPTNATNTTG